MPYGEGDVQITLNERGGKLMGVLGKSSQAEGRASAKVPSRKHPWPV